MTYVICYLIIVVSFFSHHPLYAKGLSQGTTIEASDPVIRHLNDFAARNQLAQALLYLNSHSDAKNEDIHNQHLRQLVQIFTTTALKISAEELKPVIADMQASPTQKTSFMVGVYVWRQQWNAVLQTIQAMPNTNPLEQSNLSVVKQNLIQSLLDAQQANQILTLFSQPVLVDMKSTALLALFRYHLSYEHKDISKAELILPLIEDPTAIQDAHLLFITCLVDAPKGQNINIKKILEHQKQLSSFYHLEEASSMLVSAYAHNGDPEKAEAIARRDIQNPQNKCKALAFVAMAYIDGNKIGKAEQIIKAIHRIDPSLKDTEDSILSSIVYHFISTGEKDRAASYIRSLQDPQLKKSLEENLR